MDLTFTCALCGRPKRVAERYSGRKVRCRHCGHVQRVPMPDVRVPERAGQRPIDGYDLAPEPLPGPPAQATAYRTSPQPACKPMAQAVGKSVWWRLVRAAVHEASSIETESLVLIALSAADVLITYALLRRGPAFYESNPVAQWFLLRWNIAGMALFKFGVMGAVIVIGEVVERRRPTWGRGLLVASCLVTLAVVVYGLRLYLGQVDNGARAAWLG